MQHESSIKSSDLPPLSAPPLSAAAANAKESTELGAKKPKFADEEIEGRGVLKPTLATPCRVRLDTRIAVLRDYGNPKAEAKFMKVVTTQDASKAKIYYFMGDQFGNNEATAYIQAKGSIHFITLSARSSKAFRDAVPAFDALVTSYEDLTKPPAEVSSLFH